MDGLNFAGNIPDEARQTWERQLLRTTEKMRDTVLARNLIGMRQLAQTVEIDTVMTVAGVPNSSDGIAAKIVAKGTVPDVADIAATTTDFKQYQIAVGFYVNERDLNKDPTLQTKKIDWATRQIHRREDTIAINGDSSVGLSGIVSAAQSNPNGKVVASGASGNNTNNCGAWDGSDSTIDIYTDILNGITRIGDEYQDSQLFLVGKRATIAPIRRLDDMRKSYADEIVDLFGARSVSDFVRYSAYVPDGYVYIVAKDADAAEFTVSQDILIDTNYPKEKGGNFWIELKEWVNPFQLYDAEAFVEICTL